MKFVVKKAVVLAGGMGKRFIPLSYVMPKPLIPLKDKKPVIFHIINKLYNTGIRDFYFCTGYMGVYVESYIKEKYRNKIKMVFIREKKKLGTAGPLYLLKKFIDKNEEIIVTNADIITELNFKKFIKFSQNKKSKICLSTHLSSTYSKYGIVNSTKNNVSNILEKPKINSKINAGIYILNTSVIDKIPKNKFFTMVDLINKILKEKGRVSSYEFKEMWRSIESIEDI